MALSALPLARPAFAAAPAVAVDDAEHVESAHASEALDPPESPAEPQADSGTTEADSVAVEAPLSEEVASAADEDIEGIAILPRDVPEPRQPTDYGAQPLGSSPAQAAEADRTLRLDAARQWRDAGIAGLCVGVVLIGGAIAIGSTNPADPRAGNSGFADARNRAAWTMGTPGGLLAIGGVVMLSYGLSAQRRLRVGGRLDRASAGLEINWRF